MSSGKRSSEFERLTAKTTDVGLASEFWEALQQNKKWWLVPILLVLVPFGVLMLLSATAAAPFIYTMF
jgi:hypothetical protein